MRMPLEEDLEAVVEGVGEGQEQQPDLAAAAADFEPVDSEKVSFCCWGYVIPPTPSHVIGAGTQRM